jgi:hypothetical protein
MQSVENNGVSEEQVNYDGVPIVELTLGGFDYRVDTGHGSQLAISHRASGTWSYAPLMEGRWDGTRLKAKGLDYELNTALAQALKEAMRDQESFE